MTDFNHQQGTSFARQAPFLYVRGLKHSCPKHAAIASVGPGNTVSMQVQDGMRQAIYARQFCTQSPQECDAVMLERIRNADPPPRG